MKTRWLMAAVAATSLIIVQANAEPLDMEAGMALAQESGCMACHQVDQKRLGPSWNDVSAKYKDQDGAQATLEEWIKTGGTGRWEMGFMPPYSPRVSDENIAKLAEFILTLK